jgi:O-antigen/teichoic acid export membrane protein
LNAATGIVTARTLMPAGRGQLAAIILWSLFLAGMSSLGIPSSLIYFLRNRPDQQGKLAGTAMVMIAAFGLLAAGIGALGMPFWMHQYEPWQIRFAQWLLLLTPLCSLSFVFRSLLETNGRFNESNRTQVLSPLITIVAIFVLFAFHRLTVVTAAFAYCFAILPVIALLVTYSWDLLRKLSLPSLDAARLLLSYGVRSYGVDLLGTLAAQVDQVLVIRMLAPASMGAYVVMLSLSRMFNVFQNSVVAVLFPKASGRSPEMVAELTGRAVRASLAITACATTLVGIFGPLLLKIFYGKDYTSAAGCLRILLVEVTISGVVWVLAQAFMALGRPGIVTVLQALGLSLSIPCMFWLIPIWGIAGAAASLLISTIARLLFIYFGFQHYLKIPTPDLVPRRSDFEFLVRALKLPRKAVAQ